MFKKLFGGSEQLLAIDIGATSVKIAEIEQGGEKPRLVNLASAPLAPGTVSSTAIENTELVAEVIGGLLEANNIEDRRVVTCVPGPSVFTKRIKMPKSNESELAASVQLEAANFIPHNLEAVHLDFQVMRPFGKNQLEVLVVAVKNEVLENYMEAITLAGLEVAVLDVDYFALQNIFEHSYPELLPKTVACVNLGHRFSSISVCRGGESLFTGDISAGGRLVEESLATQLSLSPDQVAAVLSNPRQATAGIDAAALQNTLSGVAEELAVDLNRQLSFFWNASGADEGIDQIMIAGGVARLPGLVESVATHTGIAVDVIDPLVRIESGEDFDAAHLSELGPRAAVVLGLALREPGDKGDGDLLGDDD